MISFCKFLTRDGYFYFLIDISGWVKIIRLFNGWISKRFTKKNIFPSVLPPAINCQRRFVHILLILDLRVKNPIVDPQYLLVIKKVH
jgi:hypothetical protein